jgi:protein-S-isoprenylcysteine O-methyltransferase Ste14
VLCNAEKGELGMSRPLSLLFAVLCYGIFFATFLYLIGFVGDFSIVPRTVDTPLSGTATATAALVDVALIALFGAQHSVMARQGFKKAWTKLVPKYLERSIFVLVASVALMVMFRLWQPIGATIWNVENPVGSAVLWMLFWLGWGMVLISTFLINHFELFGLQQAWDHMRGNQFAYPRFRTPFLYRFVRHPLYAGFFLAFWAIPQMSAGHLLLAAGMSVYMLIAIGYEERDLVAFHGRDYEEYRGRVGMLLPRLRTAPKSRA